MKNRNDWNRDGNDDEAAALEEELQVYQQNGWTLRLNGKISSPHRVRIACVREHSNYMRDFIWDADRQMKEINFIRVRDRS